jgi:hypothetical protein
MQNEDMDKLRKSALDDFISKPIKTSLVEKIRKLLYPEGAGHRLNN